MKPPRSRKGKSVPEQPAPFNAEENAGESHRQEEKQPAAQASSRRGASSKQGRRDQSKKSQPPVKIVSDLPAEREARLLGERGLITEEANGESTEPHQHPRERIARRAYALYEAGGYEQGREVEHWLEAERQLDAEQGN